MRIADRAASSLPNNQTPDGTEVRCTDSGGGAGSTEAAENEPAAMTLDEPAANVDGIKFLSGCEIVVVEGPDGHAECKLLRYWMEKVFQPTSGSNGVGGGGGAAGVPMDAGGMHSPGVEPTGSTESGVLAGSLKRAQQDAAGGESGGYKRLRLDGGGDGGEATRGRHLWVAGVMRPCLCCFVRLLGFAEQLRQDGVTLHHKPRPGLFWSTKGAMQGMTLDDLRRLYDYLLSDEGKMFLTEVEGRVITPAVDSGSESEDECTHPNQCRVPGQPRRSIDGMQVIHIDGDGHCLFRSVHQHLGREHNVQSLRNLAADYIEKNPGLVGDELVGDQITVYVAELRSMGDVPRWGGEWEVVLRFPKH